MAGMLTQGQTPSSGPGPTTTPPPESPGAGSPPLGVAGNGSEQPTESGPMPDQDQMLAEAVQRIWGENFDQMIDMFENNGAEDFARSMGVAVNSGIDFLETQYGPIGHENAAKIGAELMFRLMEDFVVKGLMPDVPMEQLQDSIPAILTMYADARPDVTKEDIQQLLMYVQENAGAGGSAEQQPDPNAALSTGPGPEPSGSPVPPGVTV